MAIVASLLKMTTGAAMSYNPRGSLFKACAPGSLMLLGEYAVLHNQTAVVCAIKQRIQVTIKPREDDQLIIHSSLGKHKTTINNLRILAPFEFVLATLLSKQEKLPSGCDIVIDAEFSSHLGCGSSAAVTVALTTALNAWLNQPTLTKKRLWEQTRETVLTIQGNASGADIAASIYGGVIGFRNNPLTITELPHHPEICAVYSGHKTTTRQAIHSLKDRYLQNPQHFDSLFSRTHELSLAGIEAITDKDWDKLGQLFNSAQSIMLELRVSNKALDHIIDTLRKQPTITGSKISGSGLGDCAIGVGTIMHTLFPENKQQEASAIRQIPIGIGAQGVISHAN